MKYLLPQYSQDPNSLSGTQNVETIMVNRGLVIFAVSTVLFTTVFLLTNCTDSENTATQRGSSMVPTVTDGAVVHWIPISQKTLIENGDLIVLNSPVDGRSRWIRRIVALPGDTVDNKFLDKIMVLQQRPNAPTIKMKLSSTEYYVLGDNFLQARDSREFGPIQKDQILGKVTKIEKGKK